MLQIIRKTDWVQYTRHDVLQTSNGLPYECQPVSQCAREPVYDDFMRHLCMICEG